MIGCGLDFGTSNSAIGITRGGHVELAPVEDGRTLLPSAVFFDDDASLPVQFGDAAIAAYVGQAEGRLMRALKSLLGSSLIEEETRLAGRKMPLTRVVEIFVRHLKRKAEEFAGAQIADVVMGRPVRFVDGDDAADAAAQAALEAIAKKAGFRNVAFAFEPIAAAYHYERTVTREAIALIADIGGGTSDFSVVRVGPQRRLRAERAQDVLATGGVHIGGTDFDTSLSLARLMPLLGHGTRLVEKNLSMPNALYFELAAWATINFAYTRKNEREIAELVAIAAEPAKVERLLNVVLHRLGHRLAAAVETTKMELSAAARAALPLEFLEKDLTLEASRADFEGAIAGQIDRLQETASACIAAAGLKPAAIDTVLLTGGSSRVPAVRAAIARAAPAAKLAGSSDLLSVALGLTQMAGLRT
ncbi:MAG: Hsp70 family protein [Magnetospirillum sp.]|nr:Hsp70 family protein [Magnetospirillum sp.]